MKKSMLTKLLALMLVIATMVTCLVACSSDSNNPGGGDPSGTQQGGVNPDVPDVELTGEEAEFLPAEKNYKGYEFKMFIQQQQEWGLVHHASLEGLEDPINKALRERELLMDGMFKVIMTLDTTMSSGGALAQHLIAQEKGQKSFCDNIFLKGDESMTAAQQGRLCNLMALEPINLEASYYDQRMQQSYRVNDTLYQISGDFDTIDELVTFGLLYNDYLYKNLGFYDDYGTPYQMVSSYEWTFDRMMALCAEATANEDGQWDIDDTAGIVSENQAGYYFFLGSGITPITNKDGQITIALKEDATQRQLATDILEYLMALCSSESFCIPYRDFAADAPIRDASANKNMFIGNRALFRSSSLSTTLNGMPDMEKDFGILPIPMYDAAQRAYYCSLNDVANRPLSIPRHVSNKQRAAEITEIIAYYSRYGGDESLYEAFFDRLADAKICRKTEDRQMLMLIFSSKVFDMDRLLDITGLYGKVSSAVGAGTTTGMGSTLEGALKNADKMLAGKLSVFEKNSVEA